jgi:hypothetical protein
MATIRESARQYEEWLREQFHGDDLYKTRNKANPLGRDLSPAQQGAAAAPQARGPHTAAAKDAIRVVHASAAEGNAGLCDTR